MVLGKKLPLDQGASEPRGSFTKTGFGEREISSLSTVHRPAKVMGYWGRESYASMSLSPIYYHQTQVQGTWRRREYVCVLGGGGDISSITIYKAYNSLA